jgi:membrane-bound lytic murein transglycosylase MltF
LRRLFLALVLLAAAAPARADDEPALALPLSIDEAWTGDLDGILARRRLRVLVAPSKTFYFVDHGTQRGIVYDSFQEVEKALNRGRTGLPVSVVYIPLRREELLPALVAGRGDVAAAGLTVTPERLALVDFTDPLARGVREIVVSGAGTTAPASLEELAGREVWVRPSSSYHESLVALSARLVAAGRPAIRIEAAPEELEDEDLLEMVNADLLPLTVVDAFTARFWSQIFDGLTLHEQLVVREGADLAWAIRKGSPQLRAALDEVVRTHRVGTAFGNIELRKYLKTTHYVRNATADAERARFLQMVRLFQRYSGEYGFDWLMVAAQAYQESRLDQSVQSPVGALGVMQLMPATGAQMNVGDVRELEPNIHAGVKYLRFVMDEYFADTGMDALNRGLFAFASYNAGPARVARLRREAQHAGLDPDVWFNHVETIAARRIGRETVQYVSNIYKYYIAYKLVTQRVDERERAKREAEARAPEAPGAR